VDCLMRGALIVAASLIYAQTAVASQADDVLEQRLRQRNAPQVASKTNVDLIATTIAISGTLPASDRCRDDKIVAFGGKYALSYDETGAPCRIYDLSFPTLLHGHPVSSVPVQNFSARDYLNWMDGKYGDVLSNIKSFAHGNVVTADWVKQLRFKPSKMRLSPARVTSAGLPASFRLSDLELGDGFQFSAQKQVALRNMISSVQASNVLSPMALDSTWQTFAANPESLLAHIQLNWNDIKKVYEVFLDAQFYPINGPVALVDFRQQYKIATEAVLRNVIRTAVNGIVGFIPWPGQQIVSVALNDAFDSIDMAYDYQLNMLEGTLRIANVLPAGVDTHSVDRGLNIVFGSQTSLTAQYIQAMVQGRSFDWSQVEVFGATARYDAERSRRIAVIDQNNELVQNAGCSLQIMANYFGNCTKAGNRSIYSMLSQTQILWWNFGAPKIYDYGAASQVTLMRGAAHLLSVSTGFLNIPIPGFLLNQLSSALQTYAIAGISDEAFLHNSLEAQKFSTGSLNAENQEMLRWMYIENLNPFLVKSESQLVSVIRENAIALGLPAPLIQGVQ
jgi:hypothetical protein